MAEYNCLLNEHGQLKSTIPPPVWAHQAEYDEMVYEFSRKNPDYVPAQKEIDYHINALNKQHEHPELKIVKANFGPQTRFLLDDCRFSCFGGQAGGGKTKAGLLYPMMFLHLKGFTCVFFRRTSGEIRTPNGLLDESRELYDDLGIVNLGTTNWRFPNGTRIDMDGLQYDWDVHKHKGSEISLLYWDELTTFSKFQFWFMPSRVRMKKGTEAYYAMDPIIRASTNPDGDHWCRELFDPWIGKDGYAIPEMSGVKRWLVNNSDKDRMELFEHEEECEERIQKLYKHWDEWDRPIPMDISFIPSARRDNPFSSGAAYNTMISLLDPVEQERQGRGNWNIKNSAGKMYQSAWVGSIDEDDVPEDLPEVSGWDIASTAKSKKNKDPDFTVRVKGKYDKATNTLYVTDMQRFQYDAAQTIKKIAQIMIDDGESVLQDIPQDPGNGKITYEAIQMALREKLGKHHQISLVSSPEKGSKDVRFRKFSSLAYRGADDPNKLDADGKIIEPVKKVFLVDAIWNKEFNQELMQFPEGKHDDIVDACSRMSLRHLKDKEEKPNVFRNLQK